MCSDEMYLIKVDINSVKSDYRVNVEIQINSYSVSEESDDIQERGFGREMWVVI